MGLFDLLKKKKPAMPETIEEGMASQATDFFKQRAPLPDDLHFLASAYVFEVARREFGGRYLRGDEDNPFVLVIGQGDAQVGVCVMGKVRGRAVNGPEDDLGFFYAGIAPAVARGASATLI